MYNAVDCYIIVPSIGIVISYSKKNLDNFVSQRIDVNQKDNYANLYFASPYVSDWIL